MSDFDLVAEASRKMSAILMELEQVTGRTVVGITLREFDRTRLQDSEVRLIRSVEIKLVRAPGKDWAA